MARTNAQPSSAPHKKILEPADMTSGNCEAQAKSGLAPRCSGNWTAAVWVGHAEQNWLIWAVSVSGGDRNRAAPNRSAIALG